MRAACSPHLARFFMAKQATTRTISPASPIPDKLYFRIGEAARLCGVEAYVLRFWETEFPQLKPNKGGTGQRLYRRRDVELALRIKQLLHQEGYTIAGARQHLAQEAKEVRRKAQPVLPMAAPAGKSAPQQQAHIHHKLQQLRQELKELLGVLSTAPQPAADAASRAASAPRRERSAGPMLFE
jgi:DNA-binding transcriptional MerR regulator